jgi:hypothetical protein
VFEDDQGKDEIEAHAEERQSRGEGDDDGGQSDHHELQRDRDCICRHCQHEAHHVQHRERIQTPTTSEFSQKEKASKWDEVEPVREKLCFGFAERSQGILRLFNVSYLGRQHRVLSLLKRHFPFPFTSTSLFSGQRTAEKKNSKKIIRQKRDEFRY